jgi:hypothetical protein
MIFVAISKCDGGNNTRLAAMEAGGHAHFSESYNPIPSLLFLKIIFPPS